MEMRLFCKENHNKSKIKVLEVYIPEELSIEPCEVSIKWLENNILYSVDADVTSRRA